VIGVIGGLGPLATADFVNKVIAATPAEHDEEHVPLLISNDPRIPRRPAAILEAGESPLPRLRNIRDRLIAAGATALVMPCNTAHHWHAALSADCALPFPSIIEVACDAAAARTPRGAGIGLVATRATLATGLFERALAARSRQVVLPTDSVLDGAMVPAIAHVKAGRLAQAGPLMNSAVQSLLDRGAQVVILACTEAPIAIASGPGGLAGDCVDSTQALALATVALWHQVRLPA
jgi:aspartate racemase